MSLTDATLPPPISYPSCQSVQIYTDVFVCTDSVLILYSQVLPSKSFHFHCFSLVWQLGYSACSWAWENINDDDEQYYKKPNDDRNRPKRCTISNIKHPLLCQSDWFVCQMNLFCSIAQNRDEFSCQKEIYFIYNGYMWLLVAPILFWLKILKCRSSTDLIIHFTVTSCFCKLKKKHWINIVRKLQNKNLINL